MAFKFVNPGYPALFDTMDSGNLIGGGTVPITRKLAYILMFAVLVVL